jgi:hypothetical protein
MRQIKRVGVIVVGAALLVSGALVGGPDATDTYQHGRGDLVALSGDSGSAGVYRNAAKDGRRVGAIGISGDGIDQDDMVAADRPIRTNGDGSDHAWSVAFTVNEHSPAGVPRFEGGPLFGVQFS